MRMKNLRSQQLLSKSKFKLFFLHRVWKSEEFFHALSSQNIENSVNTLHKTCEGKTDLA